VADKVENLEKSYENIKENRNQNTPEEIRVIVRNLPESDSENTLNKDTVLIKDGLHLNDVKALTADRK